MTSTQKTPRQRRKTALISTAVLAAAGSLVTLGAPGRAEAKLLEFYADGYLGGMYGTEPKFGDYSVITAENTPMGRSMGADYFHDNSGALIGAKVGIEVLYTDIYVQFDQAISLRGFSGSALQTMIGWDLSMGSGNWKGAFGGYGGLVFAFPYTPHFPIDSDQIARVGVALELQAGAEYVLSRLFRLQFLGTFGYHYMFAGAKTIATDLAGNDASTRTHGFQFLAKAGIRFNLGI